MLFRSTVGCEPETYRYTSGLDTYCLSEILTSGEVLAIDDCMTKVNTKVVCTNVYASRQIVAFRSDNACPSNQKAVFPEAGLPDGYTTACVIPVHPFQTCIEYGRSTVTASDYFYREYEQGKLNKCFNELRWEYKDPYCWYFPEGKPQLEQFKKSSGRWEVVKDDIVMMTRCMEGYP